MKKIIIIGGGFTGTQCAKKLEKNFNITLIDNKPYFEYTPGILRTILEPEHEKKIQALHEKYLKKSKILIDDIEEISKKEILCKKHKIPFDYLIIASGSSYNAPIKEAGLIPATRAKELVMYHNKLEKAEKVLVIGGGLAGIELASEICTHYKNKDITLVHSHTALMERNHPKSRKYAEKFLKKHGVKIIFEERVKGAEGKIKRVYITDKGTKIQCDMAFICVGIKSNYEFMKKNFSELLTERNQIKVNQYLQLENSHNIFVGGDVTAVNEEKTAQTSEKHAQTIIQNIKNLENKKPLIKYASKKRPMVISLGKYDGILEHKNLVLTGAIPAFLKWFVEVKTMMKHR